jgi:hypothetical protein
MQILMATGLMLLSSLVFSETRHADAHIHGLHHVQILLDNSILQLNYEFPADRMENRTEHEHHQDEVEKRNATTQQMVDIQDISELMRIPPSAKCRQIQLTQSINALNENQDDTRESEHKDALIEAVMECENPSAIVSLDFSPAYQTFDDLAKIQVEGMIGHQSLSEMLSATRTSISF